MNPLKLFELVIAIGCGLAFDGMILIVPFFFWMVIVGILKGEITEDKDKPVRFGRFPDPKHEEGLIL